MGYITPWIAKILTQASKNFASGKTPLPFMGLRVRYLPTFRLIESVVNLHFVDMFGASSPRRRLYEPEAQTSHFKL
jgi:hypothetical protein